MKTLIITYNGFEDLCSLEINSILGPKTKYKVEIKPSVVIVDVKSKEEIALLSYRLQSTSKVMELIDSFEFEKLEDISKKISSIDLDFLQDKKRTFAVRCTRNGSHDFGSSEVEKEIGSIIFAKFKNKVDLDNPDFVIYVYINENVCYFGIDYSGTDLSKRDYKIFSHPSSLKAPVAFLLVLLSGYTKEKVLVDPFCGSGTIPIEAALYASKYSHNFYSKNKLCFIKFLDFDFKKTDAEASISEKLKITSFDQSLLSVSASKKNAKIAGIDKIISTARADIEWLDTKVDENSVDIVVTNPPFESKIVSASEIKKLYKEFFYQLEFVMKKSGVVVIISKKTDILKDEAEKQGFKVTEERTIFQGKEGHAVVVFKKV